METNNSQFIRVAIIDDHKMVVESLSKSINESKIARVTDVYYDIKSSRTGLEDNFPDVLLLDIGLPDGDGVDYCAEITKAHPGRKIIMLTSYKEFNIAKQALYNGALGYVLKNADVEEMLIGIEMVNDGEQFLCEEIDLLLKEKERRKETVIWLGVREKEVLGYLAEGYTSKEIGNRLYIDEETVRTHRRTLLIKLDAKNTAQAVRKGYEMRLIRPLSN